MFIRALVGCTALSCLVACGVDMFIQLEKRVEVPYGCDEFKLVRLPKPKEQCTLRLFYRGSNERKTPAYRGQLASDLDGLWKELPVGGTFSLDSLR